MYPFFGAPTSLMIQTLHGAFSGHRPISLRPDTVWYMIVHEVATHVRLKSDLYGHVFGALATTQVIRTSQVGDWPTTIEQVGMGIMNRVGNDIMNLFLPAFTTTTREDQLAVIVALMDTISPYYKFHIDSVCHIPEIQLEGEPVDWAILVTRTRQLREVFPQLQQYFDHLLSVLVKIEETVRTHKVDLSFWSSIYKYESGSDNHWITGWITAFLAHFQTPQGPQPREYFGDIALTPDQFPSHVSVVHFLLNDTTPMMLAGGVTSVTHSGGFLVPRLGVAVAGPR